MKLSNTATPKYYGRFREAVLRGDIPVCREIEMEMNRVDALIENPNIYYSGSAVEDQQRACQHEAGEEHIERPSRPGDCVPV